MEPWGWVLLIAGGTVLVLLALWLLLIAPRPRRARDMKSFLAPYAHRGLWGGEIPENSLAAFERAAEEGFGIELDVQLSADGEVVVFHDYTLTRMCGRDVKLATLTAAELGESRLGDSDQCIPTLKQVLEVVGGRVPLLVEMKGESTNAALVEPMLQVLRGYEGEWCVESFNPMLLRALKKRAPHVVRGLLVTDLIKDKKKGSKLLNFALSAMLLNILCRPAFIAWNRQYPFALSRLAAFAMGARSMVYTVRDEKEYRAHLKKGTYPIFEGFLPK